MCPWHPVLFSILEHDDVRVDECACISLSVRPLALDGQAAPKPERGGAIYAMRIAAEMVNAMMEGMRQQGTLSTWQSCYFELTPRWGL